MSAALEQLRAQRFAFLRAVYDASEASAGNHIFQMRDIGAELGYDDALTEKLVQYLVDEGLLDWAGMGGFIELTHWGLKEVEQAISAPEEPTEHFPPIVVAENYLHIGSMTNSQVQQGATTSVQVLTTDARDQVRALVHELRVALAALPLDTEQTQEVEADLAAVEAQLASPRPKRPIIHEALTSTRTVLEGAAGSGLASAAPHFPHLIEGLTRVLGAL
jgi:hypothetical protein